MLRGAVEYIVAIQDVWEEHRDSTVAQWSPSYGVLVLNMYLPMKSTCINPEFTASTKQTSLNMAQLSLSL